MNTQPKKPPVFVFSTFDFIHYPWSLLPPPFWSRQRCPPQTHRNFAIGNESLRRGWSRSPPHSGPHKTAGETWARAGSRTADSTWRTLADPSRRPRRPTVQHRLFWVGTVARAFQIPSESGIHGCKRSTGIVLADARCGDDVEAERSRTSGCNQNGCMGCVLCETVIWLVLWGFLVVGAIDCRDEKLFCVDPAINGWEMLCWYKYCRRIVF